MARIRQYFSRGAGRHRRGTSVTQHTVECLSHGWYHLHDPIDGPCVCMLPRQDAPQLSEVAA